MHTAHEASWGKTARGVWTRSKACGWLACQVGRAHGHRWAGNVMAACPYCGHACRDRGALREHIRQECRELEADCIPPEHTRRMRQQDFDRDPCYAPLHVVILSPSYMQAQRPHMPGSVPALTRVPCLCSMCLNRCET